MGSRLKFPIEVLERFWSKVDIKDENSCWNWKAGPKESYGNFWLYGRGIGAHRFSWIIHHNQEIPSDKIICHHCDNPRCVNPNHIYLGDFFDNNRDTIRRKRNNTDPNIPRGENHRDAKLTWEIVRKIRSLENPNFRELSRKYGVDHKTIWKVYYYKTWKK